VITGTVLFALLSRPSAVQPVSLEALAAMLLRGILPRDS
jgi:hypothetical protein